MRVLCIPLAKSEGIVKENDLFVDVFDHDEEGLRVTVNLLVPSEIGSDEKINAEERASDRLDLGLKTMTGVSLCKTTYGSVTYTSCEKL